MPRRPDLEEKSEMASVFGLSGLKSRLDDWRAGWLNSDKRKARSILDRDGELSNLLEQVVIPRLIANNGGPRMKTVGLNPALDSAAPFEIAISQNDIEAFAKLSVTATTTDMMDFVDGFLTKGHSVEAIYVNLFAPAARKLGSYWERDSQDFVDVTMGLWRIQEILRELESRLPPALSSAQGRRRALFSTMPDDQHSFGTLMITACFQRAGWDADALIEPSQSELNAKCATQHYDIIGLNVSCDCPTGTLRNLVTAIRSISFNPDIHILLGGRVINEAPELVEICGADGTAIDAPSVLTLAEHLVPVEVDHFDHLA
jgi:MerR family transcriptional regulator, light-induced transcriptional regulator